jgi:transcription antitermination factor NusG
VNAIGQFNQVSATDRIVGCEDLKWYAIHTRARHERVVEQRLRAAGITTFLPLTREVHRWSDRRKAVELPLFSCYIFARLAMTPQERLQIWRTESALGLVGGQGRGISVPDEQIDAVRALVTQNIPCSAHPFLKSGQRVRICGGALDGVKGIFISRNGDHTLVISLDALQRSLQVRISGYDIEILSDFAVSEDD